MKKVFLGMLVVALGFGTMSLTTNSQNVAKTSVTNQKEVKVVNAAFGPTYTAPWLGVCCESPLSAVERDLIKRGLPPTNYLILSTTSNTVTYKIN